MSLRDKTEYWLECDTAGCKNDYGKGFGYDDETDLEEDARAEEWTRDAESGSWYCSTCSHRDVIERDLTPLEQALLMHANRQRVSA